MRSFEQAVGVDITRRCWDCCSELTGKRDEEEFVRRTEEIDSGDETIFDDVKEAAGGSDIGAGRRALRAVTTTKS